MFNAVYFSDEKCIEEYERWLSSPAVDEETKAQLRAFSEGGDSRERDEKIKRCFRSFLVFGTGGLRGIMGPGINNINIYTIMHATQGFADFIISRDIPVERRKISIGFDTRNNSELYAHKAAQVMAGNGVKVHLFRNIRPTPELSYSIRRLGCTAGINVTASHNPKEYNGYKVYWEDGAQLLEDAADEVRGNMIKTDILTGVKFCDFDEGVKSGMIEFIDDSVDRDFLDEIYNLLLPSPEIRAALGELKLVYTPVHGAGYEMVPKIMARSGLLLENINIVAEQAKPNGNFPTAWFPNPELPLSYELAVKLAEKTRDDFIIATDPDADRTGMAVRTPSGRYKKLTGNQIGALMLDYLVKVNPTGKKIESSYAVKTFVTTDLVNKICAVHNIELYTVLTGFKYIAEIIKSREPNDPEGKEFILGFEESLGFLPGTYARDKDAVGASLLICEMAAYYKLQGMTLYDALLKLYGEYGCFYEETIDNVMLDERFGKTGEQKRDELMKALRANPPTSFGGERIVIYGDFYEKKNTDSPVAGIIDIRTGERVKTGVPDSDMLTYQTEKGHRVCIRPSGTEPKVKTYFLMNGDINGLDEEGLRETVAKFKQSAYEYKMITDEFLADAPRYLP